jgi:hypothetical protein
MGTSKKGQREKKGYDMGVTYSLHIYVHKRQLWLIYEQLRGKSNDILMRLLNYGTEWAPTCAYAAPSIR